MVNPTGFVNPTQIANAVEKAAQLLGPEMVRVRHSIRADTMGDPAIYLRIVLADWAVDEATLADVAGKIENTLIDELRPYENWGLFPIGVYLRIFWSNNVLGVDAIRLFSRCFPTCLGGLRGL